MPNRKRKYYSLSGVESFAECDIVLMDDDSINGGANYLKAWREFRRISQEELAEAVGTTQGQIAHLESDRRGLSAKWLRKLAPALSTTPGHLLDHNPHDLPTDIVEIWINATAEQRKQLMKMAEVIAPKNGTSD